jgi:hypothetical protein
MCDNGIWSFPRTTAAVEVVNKDETFAPLVDNAVRLDWREFEAK